MKNVTLGIGFIICVFGGFAIILWNIANGFTNTMKTFGDSQYALYREKYAKDIATWEKPHIDDGIQYQEMKPLPKIAPDNNNNPYTEEKRILGKLLFNEPRLSQSKQIACASCHNSELGFGDGLKTSFGHNRQRGKRNAPNISMSGFFEKLFWDGRADSLESQVLFPITNPAEMANTLENALDSIKNIESYYPFFILAFGDSKHKKDMLLLYRNHLDTTQTKSRITPNQNRQTTQNTTTNNATIQISEQNILRFLLQYMTTDSIKDFALLLPSNILPKSYKNYAKEVITLDNIAKAIASYERSLVPKNTRFNQFLQGKYDALNNKEIYGLHIFRTKARCMNCHYGATLSDDKFHNIGLSFYGRPLQDLGRYEVTKDSKDMGSFKTPSLINISKSAPYMHNGIFPTIKGVLNLYNAGFPTSRPKNIKEAIPATTPLIKPLGLSQEEIEALEAFLLTL